MKFINKKISRLLTLLLVLIICISSPSYDICDVYAAKGSAKSTGLVRCVCISDPLLLQDDERQRTDCLNCGLHIDLKKQIFLGIIIGNICFFVRKIEER